MLFSFIAFKQPRHLETVEINSHAEEVANPWYLFASPETLWRKWKLSTYWRSCMQYEIVCGVPCSLSNLTFELRGTRLFFLFFNLFIYFFNIIKKKKQKKGSRLRSIKLPIPPTTFKILNPANQLSGAAHAGRHQLNRY